MPTVSSKPVSDRIYDPRFFDMRGKKMAMCVKIQIHEEKLLLERYLIKKYNVPKEWVYVNRNSSIVVISEAPDFILFSEVAHLCTVQQAHAPQVCIVITPTTTIGELVAIVGESADVSKGKAVSFISNGKPLDSGLNITKHFGKEDHLMFVFPTTMNVDFHYSTRADVKSTYTLNCYDVSSIGDMKDLFRRSFSGEFRGLASGEDDVWFTNGTHLAKDEEYPFNPFAARRHTFCHVEHGLLQVQIKPVNSFPVVIEFTTPDNETKSRILLVSFPMSTEQLRREISTITTYPSSALKLSVNGKALKETSLSASNGMVANCSVQVKTTQSITVVLEIDGNGTGVYKKVEIYKFDHVKFLKGYLFDQYAPRDLKLMFRGEELEDDLVIDYYRIRNDDVIKVHVLDDPIHLRVLHLGYLPYTMTVCNHKTVTVLQVRQYLAAEFSTSIGKLNIIHRDRCLDDNKSLYDNGVTPDSTILIPRVTGGMNTEEDVVNSVYVCDKETIRSSRLSIQVAGITFYAPEWVRPEVLQTKTTDKQNPNHPESIIRHPNIDIKTSSPSLQGESSLAGNTPSHTCIDQHPLPTATATTDSVEDRGLRPMLFKTPGSTPVIQKTDSLSPAISDPSSSKQMLKHGRKRAYHHGHSYAGCDSEPGTVVKRFSHSKELIKVGDGAFFRESSSCEEYLSMDEADGRFNRAAICQQVESSESESSAPEKNVCNVPCLTFPAKAVQISVLEAVARELGNDWKRIAIALDLESIDINKIEYSHSRDLHEQGLQALLLWRKRQSMNATIEKLKECLRECDLALIADSITDN